METLFQITLVLPILSLSTCQHSVIDCSGPTDEQIMNYTLSKYGINESLLTNKSLFHKDFIWKIQMAILNLMTDSLCLYHVSHDSMYVWSLRVLNEEITKNCEKSGGEFIERTGICMLSNGTHNFSIPMKNLIDSKISYAVGIGGNIFSTITLIILLATYFLFSELRTLPGKNIMALSCCVLIVHTLQLVITIGIHGGFCIASGILLHFVMLKSFSWKAISSFDLWYTFSRNFLRDNQWKRKQFKYYLIISFGCSGCVIFISLMLEYAGNCGMGYGAHNHCFITKLLPHFLLFILPILLIVICNIFALIITIRNISKAKKSTKMAHQSSHNDVMFLSRMFIKISIVNGTGWCFGLLGAFIASSFCMYIYLIVVNFQGFFIFLAFCVNRRILKLYCQKYRHFGVDVVFTTFSHETRKTHEIQGTHGMHDITKGNRSESSI
ncbi:latrophilin receptor-like protein A [Hydractinia symbiolongicarpus]|uniref:latrophilin receptor-like protein A n=1 Tax=Hydractinia symbiolongicarpus TaxID=13093 RepID=UPI0025501F67|nr:latrophilin receptor-like protein A [Hydractinia symbiolongicarpus]